MDTSGRLRSRTIRKVTRSTCILRSLGASDFRFRPRDRRVGDLFHESIPHFERAARPMSNVLTIAVSAAEADLRLDRWFKRHYPDLSHGRLEKLLRTGQVRVDGRRAQSNMRLEAKQQIRVPPLGEAPVRPPQAAAATVTDSEARALQAAVLYKDADVLALNKPP